MRLLSREAITLESENEYYAVLQVPGFSAHPIASAACDILCNLWLWSPSSHGRPVLRDSRVPADTITEGANLNMTPEEIASDYTRLIEDVKAVLDYYRANTPHSLKQI